MIIIINNIFLSLKKYSQMPIQPTRSTTKTHRGASFKTVVNKIASVTQKISVRAIRFNMCKLLCSGLNYYAKIAFRYLYTNSIPKLVIGIYMLKKVVFKIQCKINHNELIPFSRIISSLIGNGCYFPCFVIFYFYQFSSPNGLFFYYFIAHRF